MRIPRKYLLGGAAVALLGAGVAEAATAKLHTMKMQAPDGQLVEVHYTGDVAPQVQFVPPVQQVSMVDPFAEMDRISAEMDAQMHAMMQRAALMQQAAMHGSEATPMPGMTAAGNLPQGTHVTYFTSSTDANGCTRTVSYSSDGSTAQPKLTRAASDACDSAAPSNAVTPVKAVMPATPSKGAPGHRV